jgi:RHS repeat-associated protein
LHYIYSDVDKLVGIYVFNEVPFGTIGSLGSGLYNGILSDGMVSDTMYYVYHDRLGSYDLLTNDTGLVLDRLGYDVWGNRVLGMNWCDRAFFDYGDTAYIFRRGFTGHEHLGSYGIINMNGRIYDPNTASFFSPDPFVADATSTQAFNRYSYCLNNPLMYTDPNGELAWFVPVIIGAVVGAYAGASIQSGTAAFWNWKSGAWKAGITGAFVGAAAGGLFASAIGATGMTTLAADGTTIATQSWGITSTIINSATINIGMNAISGGGWDGTWKAGITGALMGLWSGTGGFGLMKAAGNASNSILRLGGKLGYQLVSGTLQSMGNNWIANKGIFSQLSLGIGPVNFTVGKGQRLLSWQNNLGNIVTNFLGLGNLAFGGGISFDINNLSINYYGGLMSDGYGYGGHSIITGSNWFSNDKDGYAHELHHLWQSRALNDLFLPIYGLNGLNSLLMGENPLLRTNFFEEQAYGYHWWRW